VLGLCAGPLGVGFGLVALGQIRRSGEAGRGLAVAGVVLGSLGTALVAVLTVGAVLAIAGSGAERDGSGTITERGIVSVVDLGVGDCVDDLDDADVQVVVLATPCREPHEGEVFAVFDLPAGPYPGEEEMIGIAEQECVTRLGDYSPDAADDPDTGLFHLAPQSRGWAAGDREVVCIATWDDGPRTGPLPR
jgi:subtilisin family serine protease